MTTGTDTGPRERIGRTEPLGRGAAAAGSGHLIDGRYLLLARARTMDGTTTWTAQDTRLERAVEIRLFCWDDGGTSPLQRLLVTAAAGNERVYDAGDDRIGSGWCTYVVTGVTGPVATVAMPRNHEHPLRSAEQPSRSAARTEATSWADAAVTLWTEASGTPLTVGQWRPAGARHRAPGSLWRSARARGCEGGASG